MSATEPGRRTVLQVCEPTHAGAARVTFNLAVGLREHGIDSAICTPAGQLADWSQSAGLEVLDFPLERRAPSSYRAAIRTVRRALAGGRFDLVHAHSSFAGAIVRLACGRGSTPVVFQPHAWSFLAVPPALRPPVMLLERLLARRTDLLVCVSDEELERAQAARIRARRSIVVPNGVDFAPDQRGRADGTAPESPTAGCIARLVPQKGVDVLVRALASSHWPAGLSVEVVGSGPKHAELAALTDELRVGERIRFAGPVDDVGPFLQRWDLFVLPSRYEGAPLALLESIAAGLPVIATDGVGMAELAGAGSSTVPVDDPDALARAVADALRDWPRTVRAAEELRLQAKRRYSIPAQVQRMAAAYASLYA